MRKRGKGAILGVLLIGFIIVSMSFISAGECVRCCYICASVLLNCWKIGMGCLSDGDCPNSGISGNLLFGGKCLNIDSGYVGIYGKGTMVLPSCGNGVCESYESDSSCSKDCGSESVSDSVNDSSLDEYNNSCPTIMGWRVEDGKCVSDSGCDYNLNKYDYYSSLENCENFLDSILEEQKQDCVIPDCKNAYKTGEVDEEGCPIYDCLTEPNPVCDSDNLCDSGFSCVYFPSKGNYICVEGNPCKNYYCVKGGCIVLKISPLMVGCSGEGDYMVEESEDEEDSETIIYITTEEEYEVGFNESVESANTTESEFEEELLKGESFVTASEFEVKDKKLYITKSNGKKAEVKIIPEKASKRVIERLGDLNFSVVIKEIRSGDDYKIVYDFQGVKKGRFLGVFKIMAKVGAQVDVESGEIVKVKKPWWSFLVRGV